MPLEGKGENLNLRGIFFASRRETAMQDSQLKKLWRYFRSQITLFKWRKATLRDRLLSKVIS